MSVLEIILRCVAGLLLVGVNAFFVVVEFALTRLRQFDKASHIDGHAGLEKAWEMTHQLEIYLTGCQLGISTSSVLLGVVAEPALTEILRPLIEAVGLGAAAPTVSVVVAVVVIQLIHKIWGEQAPTYLGVERPLEVARYCARPLYYWEKVTHPVIVAGDGLAKWTLGLFGVEITRSWAEEEVEKGAESQQETSRKDEGTNRREMMRRRLISALGGAQLDDERQEEVLNAFDMDATEASAVMIPWNQAIILDLRLPFEDNRRRMAQGGKTRYPVVDGDGEVLGAVYLQEVFKDFAELQSGERNLGDLVHDVPRVEPGLPVSDLVDQLQEAQHELAIVRAGEEKLGVVTVMDALETIFGAVRDPLDGGELAHVAE